MILFFIFISSTPRKQNLSYLHPPHGFLILFSKAHLLLFFQQFWFEVEIAVAEAVVRVPRASSGDPFIFPEDISSHYPVVLN